MNKINTMITATEQISTFAQIVDKLRDKSEDDLKLLYIKFFRDEIVKNWENLTSEMNFGDATDEDIVESMQKKRYSKSDGR